MKPSAKAEVLTSSEKVWFLSTVWQRCVLVFPGRYKQEKNLQGISKPKLMGRPGRELGTVMMWEQGHVIPTLGETANLWAAGEWAQLVQLEVGRRTGARWELAAGAAALGRPTALSQALAQVARSQRNSPPWMQIGQGTSTQLPYWLNRYRGRKEQNQTH